MMGSKERHFASLINAFLEDLVLADHFYRHLEKSLDLLFVREFVQKTYAGGGRLWRDVFDKRRIRIASENCQKLAPSNLNSYKITLRAITRLWLFSSASLSGTDIALPNSGKNRV